MGRRSGGAGPKLLVLLALVLGFGGWNYQRNLEAEKAEHRPFRSYAQGDLEALVAAYREEIESWRRRYQATSGRAVQVREAGGIGDRVREFERVQKISRSSRELGAGLSEREAVVAQIERELERRVLEGDRVQAFLQRAFVYRP